MCPTVKWQTQQIGAQCLCGEGCVSSTEASVFVDEPSQGFRQEYTSDSDGDSEQENQTQGREGTTAHLHNVSLVVDARQVRQQHGGQRYHTEACWQEKEQKSVIERRNGPWEERRRQGT